jgi:hypothetical protein
MFLLKKCLLESTYIRQFPHSPPQFRGDRYDIISSSCSNPNLKYCPQIFLLLVPQSLLIVHINIGFQSAPGIACNDQHLKGALPDWTAPRLKGEPSAVIPEGPMFGTRVQWRQLVARWKSPGLQSNRVAEMRHASLFRVTKRLIKIQVELSSVWSNNSLTPVDHLDTTRCKMTKTVPLDYDCKSNW